MVVPFARIAGSLSSSRRHQGKSARLSRGVYSDLTGADWSRSIPSFRRSRVCFRALVVALLLSCTLVIKTSIKTTRSSYPEQCNPFGQPGLLQINASHVEDNYWLPHDPRCPPSTFLNDLRTTSPHLKEVVDRIHLPWLYDKTVLLIGDSVDRNHVQQFCSLAGGEVQMIGSKHPLSPRPFRNGKEEFYKTGGVQHNENFSRPWLCQVKRYNFILLSVFQYGLMDAKDYPATWYESDSHYYAPFTMTARLEHVALPILANLGRYSVDMLSIGSSFWDVAWITKRHSIESGDYATESIPARYLAQFAERLSRHLRSISQLRSINHTKTILFRTAHHPAENYATHIPSSAVEQVDSVAQETVKSLQGNRIQAPWFAGPDWKQAQRDANRLNLGTRLRLDYSGKMMLGQTKHLSDGLHPNALPNGKIWGDMMLWELNRLADN